VPFFGGAFVAGAIFAGACTAWNDAVVVTVLGGEGGADGGGDVVGADAPSCQNATRYLSLQDAARLCALVFQCPQLPQSILYSTQVPIDQSNFSLCMTWATGAVDPMRVGFPLQQTQLQCAASAQSCLAAGACFVFEELDPTDPRCTGVGDGGACLEDGSAALNCSALQVQHCDLGQYTPGERCLSAVGGYYCALTTPCPASPQCLPGGFLEGCLTGANIHGRVNCETLGSMCNPTPDDAGTLGCGNRCTNFGATCGDGGVVVCDTYEASYFDCAAVCGTCASAMGAIYCSHPTDKCTPLDMNTNLCAPDGKTLSLCIAGQPTTFDCSTIGKSCVPGTAPQTPHCG
jgi:hypothetical protein